MPVTPQTLSDLAGDTADLFAEVRNLRNAGDEEVSDRLQQDALTAVAKLEKNFDALLKEQSEYARQNLEAHAKTYRAVRKIARRDLDRSCVPLEADGLRLPFPDGAFDAVTVAFGVRNFAAYEDGDQRA